MAISSAILGDAKDELSDATAMRDKYKGLLAGEPVTPESMVAATDATAAPELTDSDRGMLDTLQADLGQLRDNLTPWVADNPDSAILDIATSTITNVDELGTAINELLDAVDAPTTEPTPEDALVASIAPGLLAPPDEWFEPFELDGPTPITITADGRVYGHLASWDSCHRSPAFQSAGQCVKPPSDPSPAFFYSGGQVLTASGALRDVGRLTVGAGHAHEKLGLVAALEHYDDASTAAAVVRVHEDAYGIGVYGAVTPDATAEQVAAMRRSPFSGDWRKERGRFRLNAAHAVNTGGFPITRGLVASVTPGTVIVHGRVERCSECGALDAAPPALVASVMGSAELVMAQARDELRDSLLASMYPLDRNGGQ